MRGFGKVAVAALCLGMACTTVLATDDVYVRGYVSAVAEREFGVPPEAIDVRDGVVRVDAPQLSAEQRARLSAALRQVRGVTDVRVSSPAGVTTSSPPVSAATAPSTPQVAASPEPSVDHMYSGAVRPDGVFVPAIDERFELGLLPGKTLFDPLIADPRWPQIAGTYRAYQNDRRFADAGAADFGGSLSIYRFEGPGDESLSEVGLQAGVFALFDLNGESHDLVNADYLFALNYTYRRDKLSVITRVLHQSSHVGDEFLIANPGFDRINLSYEQINVLASYDLTKYLRFYAGGGWLFDQDPDDLDRWSLHYGVEYKADWTIGEHIRPVAAADFQNIQYNDWDLNLMLRAGVQFEGAGSPRGNRLMLLLEYYTGHTPDGQFFPGNTQWWGLGLHWFF